ncbi:MULTISPECIES: helix-turn-helix domain-containing protein [unclassified Nocardioides]|uniref:PucR family transcriptional regulator n=1 Tax=unclassified Nocardioides TaxID=2615069 RepID=UPI0000570BA8|nr:MULTISPECIES: helix-turn-helix domain-containing protein [unclassified Nocardioides]ABL80202.1 hypothetical protein Noca_0676 [Nocardioides sp. JS614]
MGRLSRRGRELPCFGTTGHFHAAQVRLDRSERLDGPPDLTTERIAAGVGHGQRVVVADGTVLSLSFDPLGVYRLLALIDDPTEPSAFAAEALGPSATAPSPEHDNLHRTLRVLLDTGMSVAESARLLHFRYNTLRYRITRIESLVGPFTADAQLRLRILLALQVLDMRGV